MCWFERGTDLMTSSARASTGMKCPIAQVEATGPCAPYRQNFVLIKQVKSTILIDFNHGHLKGLLDLREIKQLNGNSRENAPWVRNVLPRTLCSFQLRFCAYSRRPKDAVRFAADRELDGRYCQCVAQTRTILTFLFARRPWDSKSIPLESLIGAETLQRQSICFGRCQI